MKTYNCTNNMRSYEYITANNIDEIKDFKITQVLDLKNDIKDIHKIKNGIAFKLHNRTYSHIHTKHFNSIASITKLDNDKTFYQYTLNFDKQAEKKIIEYLISR